MFQTNYQGYVWKVLPDTRVILCGTRLAFRNGPQDYRVVCATCQHGGTVKHVTPESASQAAARDSARTCRACGAA